MGWWEQDEEGNSFALGSGMYWGDGPADIMGEAVQQIVAEFEAAMRRKPTLAEMKAGLLFSLGDYEDEEEASAEEAQGQEAHPHDPDGG
jgi:hypothetical protein